MSLDVFQLIAGGAKSQTLIDVLQSIYAINNVIILIYLFLHGSGWVATNAKIFLGSLISIVASGILFVVTSFETFKDIFSNFRVLRKSYYAGEVGTEVITAYSEYFMQKIKDNLVFILPLVISLVVAGFSFLVHFVGVWILAIRYVISFFK